VTRNLDSLVEPAIGPGEPARPTDRRRPTRQWWQRPWVLPLALVVVAFLIYVWQPYVGLDIKKSRIPLNHSAPEENYALLVSHIFFGTIALGTLCLQVWPWLRRHHPAVHRWSGRLYVFAGALPCALIVAALVPLAGTPLGAVGQAIAAVGWLVTTIMGYLRARQRRYGAHRRWMLYSFAFALNIVWGRVFVIVLGLFNITNAAVFLQGGEASTWLGWVINLWLVRVWLDRKISARRATLPV
jgi:hypothetical protein